MTLSLDPLVGLWGAPHGGLAVHEVASVSTDSRGDLSGALFVPLVGERFDGHAFLETALVAGAAAAVAQADRLGAQEAAENAKRDTRRYAKRQFTWFRGQSPAEWPRHDSPLNDNIDSIIEIIFHKLALT